MKKQLLILLSLFLILSSGCATMFAPDSKKVKDKGNIEIGAYPEGCDVLLNGKHVGKTPMKLSLNEKAVKEGQTIPKTLFISKNGFQSKSMVIEPDETKRRYNRGAAFWTGLIEGGIGITLLNFVKIDSASSSVERSSPLLGGYFLAAGVIDMARALLYPDPNRITTTRTFSKNVFVTLESNEEYQQRMEKEKLAQKEVEARMEKERLERELILKEQQARIEKEIAERKRQEEIAKAERERQEEIAKVERERQKAERLRNIEVLRKLHSDNSKKHFNEIKEGDLVIVFDPTCTNKEDCAIVSAFVEKWNEDKSKYQLRIRAIHQGAFTCSNGCFENRYTLSYGIRRITYSDAIGVYGQVDGVTYHIGEIIWIDPFEKQNSIWLSVDKLKKELDSKESVFD